MFVFTIIFIMSKNSLINPLLDGVKFKSRITFFIILTQVFIIIISKRRTVYTKPYARDTTYFQKGHPRFDRIYIFMDIYMDSETKSLLGDVYSFHSYPSSYFYRREVISHSLRHTRELQRSR